MRERLGHQLAANHTGQTEHARSQEDQAAGLGGVSIHIAGIQRVRKARVIDQGRAYIVAVPQNREVIAWSSKVGQGKLQKVSCAPRSARAKEGKLCGV